MQIAKKPRMFGSEIYRGSSYGAWHPLHIPRVSTVIDLARSLGWLPPERYLTSPRAKPAALRAWHTPAYIAALIASEAAQDVCSETRARHALGTPSNPVFPEMYRRPATGAGASILAGALLAQGGHLYNPGGGTHHGMPDRANGFCYLNDAVLAILSLRYHGATRIAYVDIDAHHCDGVAHAFAQDPDTLLISVHEEHRWPGTGLLSERGVGQVYNMPVPHRLNDTEFAYIRDRLVLPVVEKFAPDALVLQCGADAVHEDPLSRLSLSNQAHWSCVRALRDAAPRVLVLGGGGYNPWTVGRLWTGVWATLAGFDIPDRLPLAGQRILRSLSWRRQRGPVPDAWIETLADAPRPGPLRAEISDRVAWLTDTEPSPRVNSPV